MSGEGTGPEPVGYGEQSPSRFATLKSRFEDEMMLVRGFMGAAGTDTATSSRISIGAVTRTESGYCPIATRSINCGEGSADDRAVIAMRIEGMYIMKVASMRREKKSVDAQEACRTSRFQRSAKTCLYSIAPLMAVRKDMVYQVYWPARVPKVNKGVERYVARIKVLTL